MFIVYVLKSCNYKKSYTGFTSDIVERYKEHNSEHVGYTNKYRPWYIIHMEKYENREDAIKREKYLKTLTGRKFLRKIFKDFENS